MPNAGSPEAMKSPEYKARLRKGPLVMMTVLASDGYAMGKRLAQWFVYTLIVSALAGMVAGHAGGSAASPRLIFHFVAVIAFASYGLALAQNSIWYSRKWSTTFKSMFDAAIYGMLTGATFMWLWPR
jgi:hypothetical protein